MRRIPAALAVATLTAAVAATATPASAVIWPPPIPLIPVTVILANTALHGFCAYGGTAPTDTAAHLAGYTDDRTVATLAAYPAGREPVETALACRLRSNTWALIGEVRDRRTGDSAVAFGDVSVAGAPGPYVLCASAAVWYADGTSDNADLAWETCRSVTPYPIT